MSPKGEIKKIIEKALKNLKLKEVDFLVELPKDKTHGDYASNVAFGVAKLLHKNPNEVAKEIIDVIDKKYFKKVEGAGGFINFFIKDEVFNENIKKVLKNKNFGKNQSLKNQKVIVEYTDPNPFKEFHIGHLMSNSIGEAISRIFEFQGAKIKRANYQGDVGIHVAKAVWGAVDMIKRKLFIREKDTFQDELHMWGTAYRSGSERYERDEKTKQEIQEINKKIYKKSDNNIDELYNQGRKISLEYFEEIYKKLGTKFDYYFFESETAGFGKKIVQENVGKIFEEGEKGAIIFKGEKFGLHTRVFVNSEGLPTYEAKELGLAKIKYDKYKYDWSVILTGNEVNDYFKVLLAAMNEVFPTLAQKTKHIGHGMMRLPEGKMSSRTGNVITAEFLISEVGRLVEEKIAGKNLSDTEKKEIVEKVAIGALKYSILKQSIGSDIIYDFEKSISFEGDSGPYLQYSYARATSILRKAKEDLPMQAGKIKDPFKHIPKEISKLEKDMYYFPEIVEKAGKEYEPHIIVVYLTELAREFNNYYANNKIVDKDDEFSPYKVAIAEAFSIIMKNGLWLLGINVLEKM